MRLIEVKACGACGDAKYGVAIWDFMIGITCGGVLADKPPYRGRIV